MRISLFSKVVLDHPAEEAMRLAAEAGYDGIELIGKRPHLSIDTGQERLVSIKRLASDLGLAIASIPSYVGRYASVDAVEAERRLGEFKVFVHIADALGCRYLRHIPSSIPPEQATSEDWEREIAWLRRAAEYAAQYGVNLVLEMHEGSLIATADSTQKYIAMSGLQNLVVTYDVGNIYLGHGDYGLDALRKVERHVRIVHVRDHAAWGVDGKAPGTFMGDGVIDYMPLLEHLRDIGFDGYLSAECELFARPVAAQLAYKVPTADLSSAEIARREFKAIRALRDCVMGG